VYTVFPFDLRCPSFPSTFQRNFSPPISSFLPPGLPGMAFPDASPLFSKIFSLVECFGGPVTLEYTGAPLRFYFRSSRWSCLRFLTVHLPLCSCVLRFFLRPLAHEFKLHSQISNRRKICFHKPSPSFYFLAPQIQIPERFKQSTPTFFL